MKLSPYERYLLAIHEAIAEVKEMIADNERMIAENNRIILAAQGAQLDRLESVNG